MKKIYSIIAAALAIMSCSAPKDGEYSLHILTTNDLHGSFFDSTYVGNSLKTSLYAANYYVDSVRNAAGSENVILLDDGDFLQGDNAAYYFNYVDNKSTHIFTRLVQHMKYDVVVGGNHDIETGHDVYDRVHSELNAAGIPFLAGNAIRNDNGKPYFPEYTVLDKNGLKVLVLGYDNANIKAWLNESLWSGMHFESLIPLVQNDVDRITAKVKPQLVIVAVHSGTGNGDGTVLESQGLDLFQSLKGVDVLVCAHDHRPFTAEKEDIILLNSGSHARNLGHGVIDLTIKGGKVVSKSLSAGLIPIKADKADTAMREKFHDDFAAVKEFTLKEVGELKVDLSTRDAFGGMSDYLNLIHTLCINSEPAEISIAAPLTYNGHINAGTLIYNDLFTIYPFENQLFVITMTGDEIRRYLESSYDQWIQTISSSKEHVFRIAPRDDSRYQQKSWSFTGATFNFDSAAGINYTVDVTKPMGSRIAIQSMADGGTFEPEKTYNVAMTSYRASGGGGLLASVGIDTDKIEERVVQKYPEIREILFDYLKEHGAIDPVEIGNPSVIGHWAFVPEEIAGPAIAADLALLFK